MKISRAQLLAALRLKSPTPAGFPLDVPAAMMSNGMWESGGVLGFVGDGGNSLGLFQVNQPTWAKAIGAFDKSKVADGVTLAEALGYELAYVNAAGGPQRDMLRAIAQALSTVASRVKAGQGPFVFSPANDLAVWASIIWQYGSPAFRQWVMASNDLSPEGFKKFRTLQNKTVYPDFDKRQDFIRRLYMVSLKDPEALLDALRKVSIASGVDFFTASAKALNASKDRVEAWSKATTGKLLQGIKGSGVGVLTSAVALGVLFFSATEAHPSGHGRRIRPDVKQEITATVGGMALGMLAKAGLL